MLDWTNVLKGKDLEERRLSFFHDDVVPPGVSIGAHRHEGDEVYYYILSGKGRMTLDGETSAVEVGGDITAVYPGGEHGLVNDGEEDLRIVVVSVS